MACSCGGGGSYVVIKPDGSQLPNTYRTEVEALAAARRVSGTVRRK